MFTLPGRTAKMFHSINEFDLIREIGVGGLSKVYEARHKHSNNTYAIKIVDFNKIATSDRENVEKEIRAHKIMEHKNIIRLYDFFMERSTVYLVMEYCKGGNLFFYMISHSKLTDSETKKFFKQTCDAVYYMHQKGYINRDIKPENLLLDSYNNIKLCDFGWAAHINDEPFRRLRAGTISYMSPESLNSMTQGTSTDIWSLGVLLYELYNNREPYIGISCAEQLKKIRSNVLVFYNKAMPQAAKELIQAMLSYDAIKRPSIAEICKSSFLANYSNGNVTSSHSTNHRRGVSVHKYEPLLYLNENNMTEHIAKHTEEYKPQNVLYQTPITNPLKNKNTMNNTIPLKPSKDTGIRETKNKAFKQKKEDNIAQQLRRYNFKGEKALNNANLVCSSKKSTDSNVLFLDSFQPQNNIANGKLKVDAKTNKARSYSVIKPTETSEKVFGFVRKGVAQNILIENDYYIHSYRMPKEPAKPSRACKPRARAISTNINAKKRPCKNIPTHLNLNGIDIKSKELEDNNDDIFMPEQSENYDDMTAELISAGFTFYD